MFDQNALTSLQSLLAKDTTKLEETDIPAAIIPENSKVVSLEHLLKEPSRFKSKFATHVLADFITYSNENQTRNTHTYIDADNSKALTIFDHGVTNDPGWRDHTASIELRKRPAYDALLYKENDRLAQLDLIDFASDWEENIQFYDANDEIIDFKTALNRIRRLTINKTASAEFAEGDFKSNKSAMESVEIKSGQDTLPAYFVFKTAPHENFSEISFKCQLRSSSNNESIQLMFRIIGLEVIKEEIANEFKEKISDEMQEAIIYLGTVQH